MGIMVYALITYHWRASAIRRRDTGPYDDRLGPVSCIYMRDLDDGTEELPCADNPLCVPLGYAFLSFD